MKKIDPRHPNQFAAPPEVRTGPDGWLTINGYQNYQYNLYSGELLTVHRRLTRKTALLDWQPGDLDGKTVLDLGANGGYFSVLARNAGARGGVSCVEMDSDYYHILGMLGIYRVIVPRPADVVLAFALIHWLYDCTQRHGDVRDIVEYLAELTRETLWVEWVSPFDPLVLEYGHLGKDPSRYTLRRFRDALEENFSRVEFKGYTRDKTRGLWRADR